MITSDDYRLGRDHHKNIKSTSLSFCVSKIIDFYWTKIKNYEFVKMIQNCFLMLI